jgi:NAD(P)H-nitrite reductase large subunit
MRNVIIGAGPAGVVAAETLRDHDRSCDIVLLHGEQGPPYARMALPYLLAGVIDEAETCLRRQEKHFEERRIELRPGRVASVDLPGRSLTLDDDSTLTFDQLLVATGSRPTSPPVAGLETEGVRTCWTLPDAREVMKRAGPGAKVVQIGAGFVACTIMKALVTRGVELTVVMGSSGRLMRSMLCPTASDILRARSESLGVRFVSGDRIAAITAGPTVELASGRTLAADLVLVATGVEPNVSFLQPQQVEVDGGIAVDPQLRSSVPGLWAAGDVARGPAFGTGSLEVHATQPTAVEHGRVAGLNMGGLGASYHGSLRMNVVQTMGLSCCSFGRWNDEEAGIEAAELRGGQQERLVRLAFEEDRVVGANLVGVEQHAGAIRGLIQTAVPLGPWRSRLQRDPSRFAEAFVARVQGV